MQTDPALRASAHTGPASLGHPLGTAMGPGSAAVGQFTGPSAPAAPARRGRPWVAAAAVLAIVLALAGAAYAVLRLAQGGSGSPPAARQSTGAVPSTATGPGTSPPSATPTLTPTPTPTPPWPSFGPTGVPAADGVAGVTAVSGDPAAGDVATTLSAYFTGMNSRALRRAYGVFSPALQGRIGFDAWSSRLRSTHDSAAVGSGIEPGAGDALQVSTAFTSRQPPTPGRVPAGAARAPASPR